MKLSYIELSQVSLQSFVRIVIASHIPSSDPALIHLFDRGAHLLPRTHFAADPEHIPLVALDSNCMLVHYAVSGHIYAWHPGQSVLREAGRLVFHAAPHHNSWAVLDLLELSTAEKDVLETWPEWAERNIVRLLSQGFPTTLPSGHVLEDAALTISHLSFVPFVPPSPLVLPQSPAAPIAALSA